MARVCELSGKRVMAGNNVSHANNRTRRRFLPNLQQVSLPSEALQRSLRFRASTHAIRVVEKYGGVDKYLTAAPVSALSGRARLFKREILAANSKMADESASESSGESGGESPNESGGESKGEAKTSK